MKNGSILPLEKRQSLQQEHRHFTHFLSSELKHSVTPTRTQFLETIQSHQYQQEQHRQQQFPEKITKIEQFHSSPLESKEILDDTSPYTHKSFSMKAVTEDNLSAVTARAKQRRVKQLERLQLRIQRLFIWITDINNASAGISIEDLIQLIVRGTKPSYDLMTKSDAKKTATLMLEEGGFQITEVLSSEQFERLFLQEATDIGESAAIDTIVWLESLCAHIQQPPALPKISPYPHSASFSAYLAREKETEERQSEQEKVGISPFNISLPPLNLQSEGKEMAITSKNNDETAMGEDNQDGGEMDNKYTSKMESSPNNADGSEDSPIFTRSRHKDAKLRSEYLKKFVDPVFVPLLDAVVHHKPADVENFVVQRLVRSINDRNSKVDSIKSPSAEISVNAEANKYHKKS